jgi:hypothetical protein
MELVSKPGYMYHMQKQYHQSIYFSIRGEVRR